MNPRRRPIPRIVGLLVPVLLPNGTLWAQDTRPAPPAPPVPPAPQDPVAELSERLITSVRIEVQGRTTPTDQILRELRTREGARLTRRFVQEDLESLFKRWKLRVDRVVARAAPDGTVSVVFQAVEIASYEKIAFRGLNHLTEIQAREVMGIKEGERISEFNARPQVQLLQERYLKDGYMYMDAELMPDPVQRVLTIHVHEGPKVTVGKLEFVGNLSYPGSAFLGLAKNLQGSSGMVTVPGFFIFGSPAFSKRVLDEDLDRLREFYRSTGFRDARVEILSLTPSEKRTSMDIKILVDEGPRYVITSIDLIQDPGAGKARPEYPKELVLQEIKSRAGDFYSRDSLQNDRLALERFYGSRGFPSQERNPNLGPREDPSLFFIGPPEEIYDEKEPKLKVVFRLREGQKKRVRDVVIQGNEHTRDRVIRREISVYPGEMLDAVEMEKSRGRLDSLGYFTTESGFPNARLSLHGTDQQDQVDLHVNVGEGRTGQFLFGGGFSTNSGLIGNISYRKENFDLSRTPTGLNPLSWIGQVFTEDVFNGGGQTLLLDLSPGTIQSSARVTFYEPDLFEAHIDKVGLRLDGYRNLRRYESYFSDTIGGTVALDRRFGREWSVSLSFREEGVDIEDPEIDAPTLVVQNEGSTEIRALRLGGAYEDLDHRALPSAGLAARVYGELGGWLLGGETDFVKLGVSADWYVPVYRDAKDRPYVAYLRSSVDWVTELPGTDEVHPNERLYAGGQFSLRGFEFRLVGPSQFGNPVGGEARWLGGSEFQFPIFSVPEETGLRQIEIIRGALFVDAGLLGLSFSSPEFSQLRMSVGLGLRIRIPVPALQYFPLALDFAQPVFYEETDDRRVFHFRLGLR